jgi:hypothetical protein
MIQKYTMLTAGAVLLAALLATALACGTAPGSEEESVLINEAVAKGMDPLDAIYQANMSGSADEKTIARMLLEVAKQMRAQNEILAGIRDELKGLRADGVR